MAGHTRQKGATGQADMQGENHAIDEKPNPSTPILRALKPNNPPNRADLAPNKTNPFNPPETTANTIEQIKPNPPQKRHNKRK